MPEMMREVVRRTVAEREPIDGVERAVIAEFLTHFDALSDPFDQADDPVHVTGSAIVVGSRGVVLLRHKRLRFWLQPGGHLDAGETPWAAALREAREETGLDVAFVDHPSSGISLDEAPPPLIHVDVHPGGRGHTHLDLRYLVDGGDAEPSPPAGESQEIGWFDWSAAVERAHDDRLQALLAHLAKNFSSEG